MFQQFYYKSNQKRRTGVDESVCSHLLEAGDGVHEFDVQLGVVLSQRLVPVVTDELHH